MRDELGEPEELVRSERLGAHVGGRPSSARAAAARRGREAGELERVGEGLAPVGEGGLDDAPTRVELGVPGPRPAEGDERRVDVRRRPKHVRATGWKPVRSAVSWTSTETAP